MATKEDILKLKSQINDLLTEETLEVKANEIHELELHAQAATNEHRFDEAAKLYRQLKECRQYLSDSDYIINTYNELIDYIESSDKEITEDEQTVIDSVYNTIYSNISKLKYTQLFSGEMDNKDCILKITAGAGGTEAQDWANMLLRMYIMYTQANNYKVTVLYSDTGDITGIKTATIRIEATDKSDNPYGHLKSEIGVHRLVRVSPYNAQGKRMTSFASVYVTPLIDDTINVEIDKSKLTWETFRSGGAGGQNVNKVETGVRARYMYTDPDTGETEEILVENTESRKQNQNKDNARRILMSILYNKALEKKRAKQSKIEASKKKIEWGSQIRSYVLDDSRVKDHRTGTTINNPTSVLNGNIDKFIDDYLIQTSI